MPTSNDEKGATLALLTALAEDNAVCGWN